jgi:YqxM protein
LSIEGVRKIRYSRIKKFRKKYSSLVVCIQLLMVWYFIIISGIQLNSYTNASYNDIEEVNNSLQVNWGIPDVDEWDKSSLNFDGSIVTGTCGKITTTINTGENPIIYSTWRYFVYKVPDKGKKEPIGDAKDTGVVPLMKGNSTVILESTKIIENGTYRFQVRRPLDHPGNSDLDENGYSYFWSDPIEINNCSK